MKSVKKEDFKKAKEFLMDHGFDIVPHIHCNFCMVAPSFKYHSCVSGKINPLDLCSCCFIETKLFMVEHKNDNDIQLSHFEGELLEFIEFSKDFKVIEEVSEKGAVFGLEHAEGNKNKSKH